MIVLIAVLQMALAADKQAYQFTEDWFSGNIKNWQSALADFKGKKNLKYLEIGIFEGRSFFYINDTILTDPTHRLFGVDLFRDKKARVRFFNNLKLSGATNRVKIFEERSQTALRKLPINNFDIIYIDGSHRGRDVFIDLAQSWMLLKQGGILIADDYLWKKEEYKIEERPQLAIDTFLQLFQNELIVVHKDLQVIVKKIKGIETLDRRDKGSIKLKTEAP